MNGKLEKYLYFKMCIDSAYAHVGLWVSLAEKIAVGGIFIKVFGITNYYAIGAVGLCAVIGAVAVGHMLIKKGVIERQTSLTNKYNPEIQKLLNMRTFFGYDPGLMDSEKTIMEHHITNGEIKFIP